jgi:Response regulator containing a CheY-like receiver domain and an HTH DNA-binding domain
MKVIIADDSRLMRERIREAISIFSGVEIVSETENGLQTLEELKKHNPNLAIIDIRMPDMNGIEVLKKIRELKMKVKVCILTNYPYPQYRKRCFEAGADYFLSKTEDFEDIKIVIADMLRETETNDGIKF